MNNKTLHPNPPILSVLDKCIEIEHLINQFQHCIVVIGINNIMIEQDKKGNTWHLQCRSGPE